MDINTRDKRPENSLDDAEEREREREREKKNTEDVDLIGDPITEIGAR
jgi:hypothetical protein